MDYHNSMRQGIDHQLETSKGLAPVLYDVLRKMRSGFYDQSWVDVVVQKHYDSAYDIYDAWVFANVHTLVGIGDILYTVVGVGATPGGNNSIEENNNKLWGVSAERILVNERDEPVRRFVPGMFRAKFIPSYGATGSDGDGYIEWTRKITMGSINPETGERNRRSFPPGQALLEVGSTKATTTWLHLHQSRMLARWPYDSEYIYILKRVKAPRSTLDIIFDEAM